MNTLQMKRAVKYFEQNKVKVHLGHISERDAAPVGTSLSLFYCHWMVLHFLMSSLTISSLPGERRVYSLNGGTGI